VPAFVGIVVEAKAVHESTEWHGINIRTGLTMLRVDSDLLTAPIVQLLLVSEDIVDAGPDPSSVEVQ
jgi:hypothetical protein